MVNLGQDPLERLVHVGRLERARFDETQPLALAEGRGVLGAHGPEVPQVGLVADERDHDVGVGVVAQLLEPPLDVLERLGLRDVVDQQGPDGAAVVGAGDRTVPLLPRGVPDLRLDGLAVDGDRARRELDADGRLGLEAELVAGEAREEVGLAYSGVADQDDLEEVVVALFLFLMVFFFSERKRAEEVEVERLRGLLARLFFSFFFLRSMGSCLRASQARKHGSFPRSRGRSRRLLSVVPVPEQVEREPVALQTDEEEREKERERERSIDGRELDRMLFFRSWQTRRLLLSLCARHHVLVIGF